MLDNNTYNLMEQLVQEHKSLWRIQKHYLEDGEGSTEATSYWKALAKDKETHIVSLLDLLRKHL
jgi:hypothetical protein